MCRTSLTAKTLATIIKMTNKLIDRLLILGTIATLTGCNAPTNHSSDSKTPDGRSFPTVTNLDNFTKTVFVPTLENKLPDNKNAIYASALLFAWHEVKGIFKYPITTTDTNTVDFKLLNQSTSYLKSLNEDEYEAEAYMEDDAIVATAYFNKSLPFPTKFQRLDEPIVFDNEKVIAFGMNYFDSDIVDCIQILYYKNDSNFVVQLIPKDRQHRIILAIGLKPSDSFADIINQTKNLTDIGISELADTSLSWKYNLTSVDNLAIPIVKFNIETNYKTIEGQTFKTNNEPHSIVTVYQRTALILDEFGAEVESEVMVAVDSIGVEIEKEKPHPKNLTFDRPYVILLKRTDSDNPYFAMKVNNTELMIKK